VLVGRDLGLQPLLLVLAVPAAAAGAVMRARRRTHLNQRILVGVPEVSRADKGRLLCEASTRARGTRATWSSWRFVRLCRFCQLRGAWVLYALTFPALHLVVLLEERELRERFGAEYEEYCRRVPRYSRGVRSDL